MLWSIQGACRNRKVISRSNEAHRPQRKPAQPLPGSKKPAAERQVKCAAAAGCAGGFVALLRCQGSTEMNLIQTRLLVDNDSHAAVAGQERLRLSSVAHNGHSRERSRGAARLVLFCQTWCCLG